MDPNEIKLINRSNVEELAWFVKNPNPNLGLGLLHPHWLTSKNLKWLSNYKDDLVAGLEEEGILKVSKNGYYEFLIEEYKWLFRETLEDFDKKPA